MKKIFSNYEKGFLIDVLSKKFCVEPSIIQRLLNTKEISLNGKKISNNVVLEGGEKVSIFIPQKLLPKIEIVFEDENLFVINKPKNCRFDLSIVLVENYFYNNTCYAVHRLDTNTNGLMLIAKNENIQKAFIKAFKNNTIEKYYYAKVYGMLSDGFITSYIRKDEKISRVYVSDTKKKNYKVAKLQYTVQKRNTNYCDLFIKLITGRTHQIRAQFAHIGHFVLGDSKYGINSKSKELGFRELQLESAKIKVLSLEGFPQYDNQDWILKNK